MKLITPSLMINQDDPFQNDILGRSRFGVALLNLILRSKDELVVSLDGEWGEGKTTFVKMWQGLLNKSNIPNIYIDAFENDYIDNAFVAIATQIIDYAESSKGKNNAKIKEFKRKAKRVGKQMLAWSTRVGVKAVTVGIIKESDIDALQDIKNDLAKDVSEFVGDFVDERFDLHKKELQRLEAFKNSLSSLAGILSGDEQKPLVIIIDELDRCRPSYAVEIVEKIKHLFSVKNTVFVLVMNKKQLEETIKYIYGPTIDAHTYLQKFITVETLLPKNLRQSPENHVHKYCKHLYELHELDTGDDRAILLESAHALGEHFSLSLRQLEKVFTNLTVFYLSTPSKSFRIPQIVSALCVIKVVSTDTFEDLLYERMDYTKLSKFFDSYRETKHDNIQFILKWFHFLLLSKENYKELRSRTGNKPSNDDFDIYENVIMRAGVSREAVIPDTASILGMFNISR